MTEWAQKDTSSLVLSLGSLFMQYFLCLLCQMIVAGERLNPTLLGKKLDSHQYYHLSSKLMAKGPYHSIPGSLPQLFIPSLIGSSFPPHSKWAWGGQFSRAPSSSNRTWTSWSASQCLPLELYEHAASLIEAQYARCQCISVIYNMSMCKPNEEVCCLP